MFDKGGIDTERPLITQVSRFGTWKTPWQVIDIYRLVKQKLPSVQLALVGAMEAKDDNKAQEILLDLQKHYVDGDHDIHLLSDPSLIGHEEVNAFQRYSSVILQRSIREGFGFTVTEAMWKNQPVIGTSVTGLRMQITHGSNGYLVDDTATATEYTYKLLIVNFGAYLARTLMKLSGRIFSSQRSFWAICKYCFRRTPGA